MYNFGRGHRHGNIRQATTTTVVEGSATAFVRCPAFFLVREKLQHEFEANLQMALSLFWSTTFLADVFTSFSLTRRARALARRLEPMPARRLLAML